MQFYTKYPTYHSETIHPLRFVILSETKNLKDITTSKQILRYAQNDVLDFTLKTTRNGGLFYPLPRTTLKSLKSLRTLKPLTPLPPSSPPDRYRDCLLYTSDAADE